MRCYQGLLDKIKGLETIIETQKEELELLEAAFNLSEVGFTVSNNEGVAVKINPSQIKITGHDPNMTLGRSMADIQTENRNESATMKVIESRKPVTIEQTLPSGKSYLVYGQPYFDRNDELKYIICNLVDNTQHNYVRQELEALKGSNIRLEETVNQLQEIVGTQKSLIYSSKKMQNLINICAKIAPFDSTILILGESGTGKELIADYIFNKSSRANKKFIKINCAAIPGSLLESELFGYEAGAFTNARMSGKRGIFEIADGGTILLDEIGELPLHLQPKILRVLQEGEFYQVGGVKPIKTDVRIIASTNRDINQMIEEGLFREDLYYRLSVIKVTVPPLNERKEDIPLLIHHFLAKFNIQHSLKKDLTFDAIEYLKALPYQGNIRELQNTIERTVLLSHNDVIGVQEVKLLMDSDDGNYEIEEPVLQQEGDISLKSLVSQYEKELLQKYWEKYKSASKIAEVLNTNQPTISRKLHGYSIIV